MENSNSTQTKPRYRFCWLCSKKLRGNFHVEYKIDGHSRILHKVCWKDYVEDGVKGETYGTGDNY